MKFQTFICKKMEKDIKIFSSAAIVIGYFGEFKAFNHHSEISSRQHFQIFLNSLSNEICLMLYANYLLSDELHLFSPETKKVFTQLLSAAFIRDSLDFHIHYQAIFSKTKKRYHKI